MNFAIFICTHGRANNQITYNQLRQSGYTGKIYLVVDDKDVQLNEYKRLYGEDVLVFSKDDYYSKQDTFTNKPIEKCVLYARNACIDFARSMNLDYFVCCDDDIKSFTYKLVKGDKLISKRAVNLDRFLSAVVEFMKVTDFQIISAVEEGAYIGGINNNVLNCFSNKVSHFFILRVDTARYFRGCFYEDSIISYRLNKLGVKARGLMLLGIQTPHFTQDSKQLAGMQEMYKQDLYFAKFMPLLENPDCVTLTLKDKEIKSVKKQRNSNVKIIGEVLKK